MTCAISGRVVDRSSGGTLSTPVLALHRTGVAGETTTTPDENGKFLFSSLDPGEYSLSAYDEDFVAWHQSLTLEEGLRIEDLVVSLSRGSRIQGRFLDEFGRPPKRGLLTVLRQAERDGHFGFINIAGDHRAAQDGTFRRPPLADGTYLLRCAGILDRFLDERSSAQAYGLTPDRIFDFLYPDASDVSYAYRIVLEEGQTVPDLEVRIPRPLPRRGPCHRRSSSRTRQHLRTVQARSRHPGSGWMGRNRGHTS